MASEKSLSLLRASLIFFLASLMLGSAAMYIQFGIICTLLIWCLRWTGLKDNLSALLMAGKPAWIILTLFAAIFAATILLNKSVPFSEMGELKWYSFLVIFSLVLSAIEVETRPKLIEKIALAFLLIVSLYSTVDSVYQVATGENIGRLALFGDRPFLEHRGTGLLKNPIPFAHVVGALFHISVVGAVISYSTKNKRNAAILAGFAFIFFLCVLCSFARGAWFAIAVTAIFSLFVIPKNYRKIHLLGLSIATTIGILMLTFNGSLLHRFCSAFNPEQKANSVRLSLWHTNLEMLGDHPFGLGFNANDALLPEALAEIGYPESSFRTHPHNEFIDYAVATGWPGLVLYLGVTFWLLFFSIKLLKRANIDGAKAEMFLLLSSVLVQSYLNICALTDQFTTPGRLLICLAWAVPLAIAMKNRSPIPTRN